VVILDSDPLILRSFVGPLAAGMDVVDVLPDVPRVGEHRAHGVGVPGLAAPGEYAGLIHLLGHIEQGLILFVKFGHLLDGLGLMPNDGECAAVLVPGVPVWDTPAVPLAIVGPGEHDGTDTLGGHLPLQLGEDEDDLQHGLANSGAGVELLVLGDEGDAQLLELIVHGGEVQQVPADAVNLPDHQVSELTGADPVHHGLVVRAVRVLGRIAGVLKDNVVHDPQEHLDIGGQLPALHLEGVLVDLPMRRDPDVYSRLLGGELVLNLCSHEILL